MFFAKLLPFICLSFSAINCNKSESCPKKCLSTKFIGKNDASIVYKKARGRLGNQLNIYTLLLQLRKTYGYDAYMLQETYDILEKMFTTESLQELPVLEETFCHHSQLKFQVYDHDFTELIAPNSPHQKGKMYNLFPPKEDKAFVPPATQEYKKSRREMWMHLRKKLKIKPRYVKSADETFRKVAQKMKIPVNKITFVGIHHRRKDISDFAKQAFNEKPPKKSFFYAAMEHFREEYDPVAFLYVSDDSDWGKKNLKNKHKDLFFVGDVEEDDAGHDFALLVHSNHSVTTLGSFSHWVSVLNGGDTYGQYGPVIRSITNSIL